MRRLILTIILCMICIQLTAQGHTILMKDLQNYIQDFNAEIGIAINFDSTETLTLNDNIQYPLMSVMKFHQAIAVLHVLEEKEISLDSTILIKPSDMHKDTWSPLRDKYGRKRIQLSIRELLKHTLQLSDNNACDILFDRFISPAATSDYLKSIGLTNFKIKVNEFEMNAHPETCYENWSNPSSAVFLLEEMVEGKLLSQESTRFLKETMSASTTGMNRLPGFPHDSSVHIGHKTGTGGKNDIGKIIGINDIGFFLLPDGGHYTIAVFIKDSGETMETNERIIAKISEMAYNFITRQQGIMILQNLEKQ